MGGGRGPVDRVGQEDLAEGGARAELELLVFLVVEADAGHIRGEEVRGELDAGEGAVDAPGQGFGQGGLADARHVLQEDVAVAEEGHQHHLHGLGLAHDDLAHVLLDGLAKLGEIHSRS